MLPQQLRLLFQSTLEEPCTTLTRRLWQQCPHRTAHQFRVSTFPTIPSATQFAPPTFITAPQPATSSFTVQDLAQLLASSKRDHLPEWKLAQYSGDPFQWLEWYGQFKSAIDSAPLTDDVKLTYLKTLVSGKAKTTIAEFAYSGTMYKDALKSLERKFGQPQTVVSAYLDKLANYPPVKMHNSDSIISYSATVSSLVGVFRSLELSPGFVKRFAHEPSSSKTSTKSEGSLVYEHCQAEPGPADVDSLQ